MHCTNCGTKLKDGDLFCNGCGAPVGNFQQDNGFNQQNMNMGSGFNNLNNDLVVKVKSFLFKISERKNRVGLVAAIIMLISMFLPYAKVGVLGFSQSRNYISTEDGKIVIVLLIFAAMAYYAKRDGIGCVLSGIMLIITIIDWSDLSERASNSYGVGQAGIGCYLVIIASLAMVLSPFFGHKIEKILKK